MMADAAALKDRATRRLGEIMEGQRRTVGLAKGAAEKRGFLKTRVSPLPRSASTRTSPTKRRKIRGHAGGRV